MTGRWDLTDSARAVLEFRRAREWKQFHRPKELAAGLAIEAAELQELFLWRDPETAKDVQEDSARMERIAQEMADVATYLVLLSNDLEINLPLAIEKKLESNERRYPVGDYKGSARKAPH